MPKRLEQTEEMRRGQGVATELSGGFCWRERRFPVRSMELSWACPERVHVDTAVERQPLALPRLSKFAVYGSDVNRELYSYFFQERVSLKVCIGCEWVLLSMCCEWRTEDEMKRRRN